MALASSGSWIEKIGSAEYMVNTVQVKSADWTIVAVNSLDELTKNAQKTRDFTFLLATLSSLSAILVLLIFTHSFLKPLMGIVQLMKEVRKGNFQVSFSSKRNDEIGYLGDSFNAMVKTINDNIEKNTELAKKVYEAEMLHTEAQLHALQSQIKPHFLYNTLNMISMQIQVGRLEQAVDNIEKLHRLLRGMAKWDREVLVEDEFAILDAYLGIQSSRFEQRLSYELKLDDSLKKQYILAFILQPLVENAVIHGCETQRRRTKITVEAFEGRPLLLCRERRRKGHDGGAAEGAAGKAGPHGGKREPKRFSRRGRPHRLGKRKQAHPDSLWKLLRNPYLQPARRGNDMPGRAALTGKGV